MERENEEDLCLGPRGFAKSTVRVVIFSIVSLIEDPNDSILITSDTGFQSVHFMSEIKRILETNIELILLYPHLAPGRKWTDSEIIITGMTDCTALIEDRFDLMEVIYRPAWNLDGDRFRGLLGTATKNKDKKQHWQR